MKWHACAKKRHGEGQDRRTAAFGLFPHPLQRPQRTGRRYRKRVPAEAVSTGIPPQRQFEIRQNKKIIVCEYCGRILVSDELDHEEEA